MMFSHHRHNVSNSNGKFMISNKEAGNQYEKHLTSCSINCKIIMENEAGNSLINYISRRDEIIILYEPVWLIRSIFTLPWGYVNPE